MATIIVIILAGLAYLTVAAGCFFWLRNDGWFENMAGEETTLGVISDAITWGCGGIFAVPAAILCSLAWPIVALVAAIIYMKWEL